MRTLEEALIHSAELELKMLVSLMHDGEPDQQANCYQRISALIMLAYIPDSGLSSGGVAELERIEAEANMLMPAMKTDDHDVFKSAAELSNKTHPPLMVEATQDLSVLTKSKSLDYYRELTAGGDVSVSLRADEACVALKVYDYGVDVLNDDERQVLYRLFGKLKDKIWP